MPDRSPLRKINTIYLTRRPGEKAKKWYQSAGGDLFLWLDPAGSIEDFQLSFPIARNDREGSVFWRGASQSLAWQPVDKVPRAPPGRVSVRFARVLPTAT